MSCLVVSGGCTNESCESVINDELVDAEVEIAALPDGWGQFDGDFGECPLCGGRVNVMFDLQPEDLAYVD